MKTGQKMKCIQTFKYRYSGDIFKVGKEYEIVNVSPHYITLYGEDNGTHSFMIKSNVSPTADPFLYDRLKEDKNEYQYVHYYFFHIELLLSI